MNDILSVLLSFPLHTTCTRVHFYASLFFYTKSFGHGPGGESSGLSKADVLVGLDMQLILLSVGISTHTVGAEVPFIL